MRLLLVEDERGLAEIVAKGLREFSFAVDWAWDGAQALYRTTANSYDLAIVDVRLPGQDGFSLCRELRKASFSAPILLLSALDDPEDIVCGLNSGADDYIAKPFAFPVLIARIRTLLRRAQQPVPNILKCGELRLNTFDHTVLWGAQLIQLTAKEYALLELFMIQPGKTVSRHAIAERVWEELFDPHSNVIDVYVNRLRKKLNQCTGAQWIETRRSLGYVLRGHATAAL